MEDRTSILQWLLSFDGVAALSPDSLSSLRCGRALAAVYNQLQCNDSIDLGALRTPDARRDDWVARLMNLKVLQRYISAPFSECGIQSTFDMAAIARGSGDSPQLWELIEAFVLFSLRGPKGAEGAARVAQLPDAAARIIRSIAHSTDSEYDDLQREHAALRAELQQLRDGCAEYQQLCALRRERAAVACENARLDAEIAQRSSAEVRRQELLDELSDLNAAHRRAEDAVRARRTLEWYESSGDPNALGYVREIRTAEAAVDASNVEQLEREYAEAKRVLKKLAVDVRNKTALLKDQPQYSDDAKSTLSSEISALSERNNALNRKIVDIVRKTEFVEQQQSPMSLLEQMRIAANENA